jgi:hypothetical protein
LFVIINGGYFFFYLKGFVMVFAHTIGHVVFDVLHHGIIFGLGLCGGLVGSAWLVSRKVK